MSNILIVPGTGGEPAPTPAEPNVTKTEKDYLPTVIMKGGTTSSAYDKAMAAAAFHANARREQQDAMRQEVEGAVEDGSAVGSLGEQRFITAESPKILLQYMNDDGSVAQECVSEIMQYPDPFGGPPDIMFVMVCPKCVARGVPQGEAQVMVKNRHRKWFLDERKRGVVNVEVPGIPGGQILHRAGTVTCNDIIRCSNFNCDWAVRVDDSKVRRA